MAHSSGGGSHGGGCHGGGCSSGQGGSHRRYSHHRFPGSHPYSYTDLFGRKRRIYTDGNPIQSQPFAFVTMAMIVFMLVTAFGELGGSFLIPRKLKNPCDEILIEDSLRVIEHRDRLEEELLQFYRETGVTPVVKTVGESQWNGAYNHLMDYSLAEYYRLFDDEKHWLIVCSAPVDAQGNADTEDWSFEGIIGDDTGPSINDRLCEVFTTKTYDSLMANQDLGRAIAGGFRCTRQIRASGFFSLNREAILSTLPMLLMVVFLLIWLKNIVLGFLCRNATREW